MFDAWIHWLSSATADELLLSIAPLLLLDAPRYAFTTAVMCMWDAARDTVRYLRGTTHDERYAYCPSVCVVMAGLNEADTILATLTSLWDTYPRLEIIVVDDGSTDGMSDVARGFAESHSGVLILRKPERGGKSSALNFALPFTQAEIVVSVDADSHLAPGAIWEIVQPFSDPRVGAVSSTVLARNAYSNPVTWLQAAEYVRSIFVGRMLSARLGILGIVSGAFGAFRRDAIRRAGGWDVGPGEDGDIVLRLRKGGYRITHAPYAQCFTNLPTTWRSLFKQRRRWEWAIVTFECRKHVDLANFSSGHFKWTNLLLVLERWIFNVFALFAFWGYVAWICLDPPDHLPMIVLTSYAAYVALDVLQGLTILYYSNDHRRDIGLILATPLMPVYYLFQRVASTVAVVEELLFRRSFDDNFVPERVRSVTWRW